MKKILLSLALVMCCLTIANAQLIQRNPGTGLLVPKTAKAPTLNALGENQLYMGPYTSDAIAESGLGITSVNELIKMGAVLPLDMVTPFEGGTVKAIRFGLCAGVSSATVLLYPITSMSPFTVGEPLVEQSAGAAVAGWNTVELTTPVTLSTDGIVGLMLGFEYMQKKGNTNDCYPISAVDEGTICVTYANSTSVSNGQWADVGLSSYGNLSVQAIVENENFPAYNLILNSVSTAAFGKISDGIDYTLNLVNMGVQTLQDYKLEVLVDGVSKGEVDSPVALTSSVANYTGHCATDGLASGKHTLTVRVAQVAGEAVTDGSKVSCEFTLYEQSYPRQKQLVEQFTSQYCTYCPLGETVLKTLESLRGGDLAWVAIHGNMSSGTDIFTISEGNSLMSYMGVNSFPSAAFNRFDYDADGALAQGMGYDSSYAQEVAEMLNAGYFGENPTPSLANINLSGSYDTATRELKITVAGEASSDFTSLLGSNVGVTVYVTEDGLVAKQLNNGRWVTNYTHNHVLRDVLSAYNGTAMKWDGNNYSNEFTATLDESWNIDNMHVIAFLNRKGTGTAKEVINCEMLSINDLMQSLRGDVNNDGVVDIQDINIITNIMLGLDSADNYNGRANLTEGDNDVDIADLNEAINIVIGL